MTTYLTTRNTSPWFLASIIAPTPGVADAAWQPGRHVYVRVRAGLVDVRGADGVYAKVTVGQAAARLRRIMGTDGRPLRVRHQERWCEECGEWWAGRHNRTQNAA